MTKSLNKIINQEQLYIWFHFSTTTFCLVQNVNVILDSTICGGSTSHSPVLQSVGDLQVTAQFCNLWRIHKSQSSSTICDGSTSCSSTICDGSTSHSWVLQSVVDPQVTVQFYNLWWIHKSQLISTICSGSTSHSSFLQSVVDLQVTVHFWVKFIHLLTRHTHFWSFVWKTFLDQRPKPHDSNFCKNCGVFIENCQFG